MSHDAGSPGAQGGGHSQTPPTPGPVVPGWAGSEDFRGVSEYEEPPPGGRV